MNKHIYFKELKRNRKQLLLWSAILSLFCSLIIAFYPSVAGDQEMMNNSMKMIPKNLQKAIGMRPDQWSNVLNYISTYYGFHITILSCIFSIIVAGTMVAKEEGKGTADFLLTRPVTRNQVVASKLLAYFTLIISLHLVIVAVSQILFSLVGKLHEYSLHKYLVMVSYGVMENIFFGALGLFCSILIKRGKSFVGSGVGIVIGTFILESISKIDESINWLGYFSPFYFVDFKVYELDYDFTWWRVLFFLGISAILFVSTFLVYRKKDIYA